MVYERVRGWTSGRSLPVQNFVKFPPPPGKGQALLGRETATQMNVLCLGEEVSVNVLKQEDIFDKYKSCFEGPGKLKDFQLDIPAEFY